MSDLVQTADGRTFLHIWRTSPVYEAQKGSVFLRQCVCVRFVRLPFGRTRPVRHVRVGKPLPFPDCSFDLAYLLHVLEHQTPEEQIGTLRETWRVLKPGGWVRVSVPDQEEKARVYLQQLANVRAYPSEINRLNYEWAVMSLLDQMVRRRSGGSMAQALRQGSFDPGFLRLCFGDALDSIRPDVTPPNSPKLHGFSLSAFAARWWRRLILWWSKGDPRLTGELDLWGHDEVWLANLLSAADFTAVERMNFEQSDIPGWERFALDRSERGNYPLEPSLFMEAYKPTSPALNLGRGQ